MFSYVSAQEGKDFVSVNSSTLELLNAKQWDKLILACEDAIDNGIDYFYLRMRIGIAYYNKGEYISAANQFEEALSFNSADEVALEYLYYSYIFSARAAKANHLQGQMTEDLRARLKISGPKFFDCLYAESGVTTGNNSTADGAIRAKDAANSYGEFYRGNNQTYYQLGFMNWIGNDISLYYGYSAVGLSVTKQIFASNNSASSDYTINQTQYYVSPAWQVGRDTKITAAYNAVNVSYATMNAAYNSTTDQYIFTPNTTSTQLNDYVEFLSLSQDMGLWTCSLFYSYSQLSKHKQNQEGLEAVFYPSGNNDIYFNTTVTQFNETDNTDNGSRMILDEVVGVKLSKSFWVEGNVTSGKLKNYNEKNAYVVYNLGDDIKSRAGVSLLFYLGAVELSLRFQYLGKEATYYTFNSAVATKTRTADYQAESIVGGLKWNF